MYFWAFDKVLLLKIKQLQTSINVTQCTICNRFDQTLFISIPPNYVYVFNDHAIYYYITPVFLSPYS